MDKDIIPKCPECGKQMMNGYMSKYSCPWCGYLEFSSDEES